MKPHNRNIKRHCSESVEMLLLLLLYKRFVEDYLMNDQGME